MTQNIIDLYGIRLINKTVEFPIKGKIARKIFDSNSDYLKEYINDYSYVEDLDELMTDILYVINNSGSEIDHGSVTLEIILDTNKIDFYTEKSGFVYTIPTSDFKQIIEGWRQFLLEPPVIGTKLK